MKKIKITALILAMVACIGGAAIATASIDGFYVAEAANIVKGDTTANIKAVQTKLKSLGYYTYTVDGIWGSRTRTAVKKFQTANGLVSDGIVGAKTEKALGITLSGGSSTSTSSTNSSDVTLLARCVYGEARGEPELGRIAVAAVVLNRVKSSSFPNSISGVIYQSGAFTCVADGQINMTPNEQAYAAARAAINGYDPTYGCLYYYNPATATSKWIWSLKVAMTIGKHSFAYGK